MLVKFTLQIITCLEKNTSLRALTLDSNAISAENIVKIIAATSINKTLQELKCSNQVHQFLMQ